MQKPIFLFYKLQGLDLECAYVEGELTVCYGNLSYNILLKVCFIYCLYVFGDGDSSVAVLAVVFKKAHDEAAFVTGRLKGRNSNVCAFNLGKIGKYGKSIR